MSQTDTLTNTNLVYNVETSIRGYDFHYEKHILESQHQCTTLVLIIQTTQ